MMRTASCESDLSFDLLLAGDLPEDDERRVRVHLDTCRQCAARWAELRSQRDVFNELLPPIALSRRVSARPQWRRQWLVPAAALAAAAGLLLAFWPREDGGTRQVGIPGKKGAGTIFRAYIRHGDDIREAGDTEVAHPGDQLQFVYSSSRPGFVAILSRDGAGLTSIYFPDGGRTAWPVPAGRDRSLPRSTILDETTGPEVVLALFCSSPTDLDRLRDDLAAGRAPRAPPGCTVETMWLDKKAAE
jgi:Putative zinc-finger